MKVFLVSVFTIISCIHLYGQNALGYPYLISTMISKPDSLKHVTLVKRKAKDVWSKDGGEYTFVSDNKRTRIYLNRLYWAVEYDTALYVNISILLHLYGYAPVLYRTPEFLYFRASNEMRRLRNGALIGGAIGIAVAEATKEGTDQYFIYLDWGKAKRLTYNNFSRLLKITGQTELLSQYTKEENPTDTATYFKYIRLMRNNNAHVISSLLDKSGRYDYNDD